MADPIEPVTLGAGDLVLRPWRPGDAGDVHRICQDPDIPRWTTVPSPYSLRDAAAYVAESARRWAAGRAATWAVVGAGTVLGSIVLADLDRPYPELGYWVAPEARGRGVTAAAAGVACRWAFERGAPKVGWIADVGNEASWRVAHRVGFAYEGRRPAEIPHGDGPRTDAWVASLVPGRDPEPWPYEPFAGLADGEVTLRRWRIEDAELLVELEADPDVAGWAGPRASKRRTAPEAAADIAGRVVEDWLLGRAARLAICLDGEPVGGISLRTPDPGTGRMGWWLGPAARGRGVGTRAVRLLAGWGFEHLGLRRLSAGIAVGNAPSRALAGRVGFVEEGAPRLGAPAFGSGWSDAVSCGLLPGDLRGGGAVS